MRLAPSLLDRLIDLEPDLERDPNPASAESFDGIRAALRRDLEILLNTRCTPSSPASAYPELADSLLAYGVEDFFAASLASPIQREDFARRLQERIARFETRLEDVSVTLVADATPHQRKLRLRISAHYHARPGLPPLVFETSLDPVAGRFLVADMRMAETRRG
ncbi:type VI secretion system baseplate subunit TssE [Thalassococcus sp. S3]|uniref:type VI secretion system baseplate subunit TssE n=1 Tax=Thalassococcus sp. S3 TaxID=2017482 RepID=UPI0013EECC28|nr:type VI secretion system baseplate subunit TssE [Thalassococcus sp. S3]